MAIVDKLKAIGDAIRYKTGKTELMNMDQMALEIRDMKTGSDVNFDDYISGVEIDTLSSDVSYIRPYAFYGYTQSKKINFPNVTRIGHSAFSNYDVSADNTPVSENIEWTFPKVVTVDSNAFAYFKAPNAYDYDLSEYIYSILHFPLLKSFPNECFIGSGRIIKLDAPNIMSVGNDCFKWSYFDELTFPNLHTVNNQAFYYCYSLKRLDIGSDLTTIGTNFCRNCTYLTTLIIRAERVPPLVDTYSFRQTSIESGTGYIYVPSSVIEEYKVATNWSVFAEQFRAIEDYPEITGGTTA